MTMTGRVCTMSNRTTRTFLVAYSVIHSEGTFVSREFIDDMQPDQIVTRVVIQGWEYSISKFYKKLDKVTVRIISFQEL
jgi:hypothetical protein